MGFDKNTITGFILLGILFIGYFLYTSNGQQKLMAEQKHIDDSVALVRAKQYDPIKQTADSLHREIRLDSAAAGNFQDAAVGTEAETYLENNLMKITFSNKGGWLKKVELKKYKGIDSQLVIMGGLPTDHFGYAINTGGGNATTTDKMYFHPAIINKLPDNTQTISYQIVSKDGKSISHTFTIKPDNYMVDANIALAGADQLLSQQSLIIDWNIMARQQQKNITYEKQQLKLVARTNDDFDSWSAVKGTSQQLDKPTNWFGLKQQFFNATIVAKPTFSSVQTTITVAPSDTVNEVGSMEAHGRIQVPQGNTADVALQIYYGPNDYKTLKAYNNDMLNIVDLGSGFTAFVKYINRGFIMPVFNFLVTVVGGKMGWAILLLTLLIRLVISPITYRSYLSGAKMKVMQPELKVLKAKFGDDQQAYSVAQMKLFREAGINPLSGCIPMAAQLPVFFALFAFFNSNIDLRGQPFLWATDLSMYDTIYHFSFKVPLIGDHISLFTITACISSFFISMYSMSSTPDQSNPAMKYMPYIFPFMMLFFFNNQPAALTWYYTISNTVTLVIQIVIQKYIIDHDKILADIAVKRSQPKTKSKWQEKLEAMQNTQKNVADLRAKTGKK